MGRETDESDPPIRLLGVKGTYIGAGKKRKKIQFLKKKNKT